MERRFAPLLLALVLAGCATFSETELAQVRARGVSASVASKLDLGRPLSPADVIELHRRRVPETWVIRHLDDHGVDSLVTRTDLAGLRKAGVHAAVVAAVVRASDDFAARYRYPDVTYSSYYGDPYYGAYGRYPWYGYAGFGASITVPLHHRHPHHRHRH